MQLRAGRIPMTGAEEATVEKLLAAHAGRQVSLTRRDPGNTGPLLVHVTGVGTWVVQEGSRKKVTANG